MRKEHHVVPNKEKKGWEVKVSEVEEPLSFHKTQAEAIKVGRTLAKSAKTEFVIHGRDGRIRQKDSYGNDPKSSKG